MFNRVFLIGNLTRDPEVRYLPSGTAVTSLRLAVTERFRDRSQELREDTLFIDVDTFDRLAETCSQYLKKGRLVFVEGKLRINTWEGKDGVKRSRPVIRGLQVKFIEPRPVGEEAPAGEEARAAQPSPARESAEADAPAAEDVPEYDVNEQPSDSGADQSATDDDLPF